MEIQYKASGLELTQDIRVYTEEKMDSLQHLLGKQRALGESIVVDLTRKQKQQSGDIFRADITVHVGSQRTHAVGHGETIMAALDDVKDELARRLVRTKVRRLDAMRRGGAKIKEALRFWK